MAFKTNKTAWSEAEHRLAICEANVGNLFARKGQTPNMFSNMFIIYYNGTKLETSSLTQTIDFQYLKNRGWNKIRNTFTPFCTQGIRLETTFGFKVQNRKHLFKARYKIGNIFFAQSTKLETPLTPKVQD